VRKKILVIGDIILDKYIRGSVVRISPEAPVPIVDVEKKESRLGGAANVAANIATLGGKVDLVGVIGKGRAGANLLDLLDDLGVGRAGVLQAAIPTTVKTRVTANHQHIVRYDNKGAEPDGPAHRFIQSFIENHVHEYGVVVVSDYNKGIVSNGIIDEILKNIDDDAWLIGDPSQHKAHLMKGFNLITPNMNEACTITGISPGILEPEKIAQRVLAQIGVFGCLVTMGAGGMYLDSRNGANGLRKHYESQAREVYDVTGAGDTVLATIAHYLAESDDLDEACHQANKAAGVVVGKLGTATVTEEEL